MTTEKDDCGCPACSFRRALGVSKEGMETVEEMLDRLPPEERVAHDVAQDLADQFAKLCVTIRDAQILNERIRRDLFMAFASVALREVLNLDGGQEKFNASLSFVLNRIHPKLSFGMVDKEDLN